MPVWSLIMLVLERLPLNYYSSIINSSPSDINFIVRLAIVQNYYVVSDNDFFFES